MPSATRQPAAPSASARDRLLTAALERFAIDGPVAVSLEEIRHEAGVSVGALYHHFADKAALVEQLYVALTVDFQRGFIAELRSQPNAEQGVRGGVGFYLHWVTTNRAGARVLLGHRPGGPALSELNRTFLGEVKAWWDIHVHYGSLRSLGLDMVHALWLGPAHEYTRQWLDGARKRPPAAAIELLSEAAWNSLKEPR